MGIKDLVSLYRIVKYARELENKYNWGYNFKWDQGSFETAILIHNEKQNMWQRPESNQTWKDIPTSFALFCPDIVDFDKKIIIEYDETPGKPRSGARLAKKGHDPDGMDWRTEQRNLAYTRAGFNIKIILDTMEESKWKEELKKFLIKNYVKTQHL